MAAQLSRLAEVDVHRAPRDCPLWKSDQPAPKPEPFDVFI
jgi:hypothetical protein